MPAVSSETIRKLQCLKMEMANMREKRAKQIRDIAGAKTEIGSQEYAEQVTKLWELGCPENWKFINQGAFRSAYLGPDGVVYKRDHNRRNSEYNGNIAEARTLGELKKKGYLWVPRFRLFDNDTIAMQFLSDITYPLSLVNRNRRAEIQRCVNDSLGSNNIGLDPETELLFLRDAGNGTSNILE